ncbi:MAG: choice-of-anchor B family protein [Rhodothermales bacterium]
MQRILLVLLLGLFLGSEARAQATATAVTGQRVACANGKAINYACNQVDLLAFLPLSTIGGRMCPDQRPCRVNDLWGWTDPATNKEYALVGRTDGTAFVDISDPLNPIYLGKLPTHTVNQIWRDIKVYNDHAFIVADGARAHGMQIFDLTQLRAVANPPVIFAETAHYAAFSSAHNVVINEDTGFAYVVGANSGGANSGGETCGGGLHMVNIQDPVNPFFVGCFQDESTGRAGTGYTHDAQCVVYHGPDVEHQGREICIGANETAVSIADVTDKGAPVALSSAGYPNLGYVHQGWLTEDHRYYFQNDEFDEMSFPSAVSRTRTLIWDLEDLDDPLLVKEYSGPVGSTDHNLYIREEYVFMANYTSGLRIVDISDIRNPREVAFFDTYIPNNDSGFGGAWSNYPFFKSEVVIISSQFEGLFIVQPSGIQVATEDEEEMPAGFTLSTAFPNPFNPQTSLTLTVTRPQPVTVSVHDVLGREVARLLQGTLPTGSHHLTFEASDLPSGTYMVRAVGATTTHTRLVTLAK